MPSKDNTKGKKGKKEKKGGKSRTPQSGGQMPSWLQSAMNNVFGLNKVVAS